MGVLALISDASGANGFLFGNVLVIALGKGRDGAGRRAIAEIMNRADAIRTRRPNGPFQIPRGSFFPLSDQARRRLSPRAGERAVHRSGVILPLRSAAPAVVGLLEGWRIIAKGTPGGWGGIRTHGGLAPTPVFKTGALNHSATHP